jgi:hypothetical protein
MAGKQLFFSFHYKKDNWRASQIRNMGVVEGNKPVSDNDWETVTKGGDKAIEKWINEQLTGRSCTVVLVGKETADRKWIDYEIKKTWNDGKGIFGIYVHNLKDKDGNQTTKGKNPFVGFKVKEKDLSEIVKCYDPPYTISTNVYDYIQKNIAEWAEEAIKIRDKT